MPTLAQPGAQSREHVEHHADTRQRFALEATAGLVRIDECISQRQLRPRQMMIGDDHAHAEPARGGHAGDAGDAVVHGDEQLGPECGSGLGERRRQPIAHRHPIRHHVVDVRSAHRPQAQHRKRDAGRAVGIVVAGDDDALAVLDRGLKQIHRDFEAEQAGRHQHAGEFEREFVRAADSASGIDAVKNGWNRRVEAVIDQRTPHQTRALRPLMGHR